MPTTLKCIKKWIDEDVVKHISVYSKVLRIIKSKKIIKSRYWEYGYSLTDFQRVLKFEIFHNEILGKNKLTLIHNSWEIYKYSY